jgi:hypothetical protein
MHDIDARSKAKFDQNFERAFGPNSSQVSDFEKSDDAPSMSGADAALLAELDAIGTPDNLNVCFVRKLLWTTDDLLEDYEKTPVARKYQTPYESAFIARNDLEAKLEALSEIDSIERAIVVQKLQSANVTLRIARDRSTDDVFRKRWSIDEYRADAGRAERNTGRRKVRVEPNADLSATSDEERKARLRAQKAESAKRISAAKKALGALAKM